MIYKLDICFVIGNLLGAGDKELSKNVEFPFSSHQFLYVGIQEPLDIEVKLLEDLNINYTVQDKENLKFDEIQQWIKKNSFTKIAIHLDLDVLDPNLFRSLYFSEPGVTEYPSESGKMTCKELLDILKGLFKNNEVVAFTIAEFLPWDAINLKDMLSELDIFKQ